MVPLHVWIKNTGACLQQNIQDKKGRGSIKDAVQKEISDSDKEVGRAGHELQVWSYAWMTSLHPSSSPWEWAPWKRSRREQSRGGGGKVEQVAWKTDS